MNIQTRINSMGKNILEYFNPIEIYLEKTNGYPIAYTKNGNKITNRFVEDVNDSNVGKFKITSLDNPKTIGGVCHFFNYCTFEQAKNIIKRSEISFNYKIVEVGNK